MVMFWRGFGTTFSRVSASPLTLSRTLQHLKQLIVTCRQRQRQQTTPRTQVLRKQPVCLQTLYYILLSCYTQELSKVKPEILNQFIWAVLSLH